MVMAQMQPEGAGQLTWTVSRNVRALMAANGISQVRMAAAMGMAQSAISNRLRGLTPWTTEDLEIVGLVLDVSPVDLVNGALLPRKDSNLQHSGSRIAAGQPFVHAPSIRFPDIARSLAA